MKRPDRSPDWSYSETIHFWFEEMIQTNKSAIYTMKITNDLFFWTSKEIIRDKTCWVLYEYGDPCSSDIVLEHYKKWLIKKALKEKLNEENS